MDSSYGPVDVALFGSIYPEGETITKAKITLLGGSPNATARLFIWIQPTNGLGRFREFDTITQGEIREGSDGFTITGISQQLIEDVGVAADNAKVTWEVTYKGCETC